MKYFNHNILRTWSQERCIICQRFLGNRYRKYCKRCGSLHKEEYVKSWNKLHYEDKDYLRKCYQKCKEKRENYRKSHLGNYQEYNKKYRRKLKIEQNIMSQLF